MRKIFYTILLLSLSIDANSIIIKSQKENNTHWTIDYAVSDSKVISAESALGSLI